MLDVNKLCFGCMSEKVNSGPCKQCGYEPEHGEHDPRCLQPGTILNGRYILGKVLGQGGFGITYIALDLNLETRVAIKEYMPDGIATRIFGVNTISVYTGDKKEKFEYGVEKFFEEAKILAKFNNVPSVVSVQNFFHENGTGYFVMEFVEGLNLKQYIRDHNDKLTCDEVLKIVLPVMDALRVVHEKGLLHRDISPDNIYIAEDGTVKLLDFGAARYSLGEHSKSLSVVLKPGYAPEEQYRSRGKQGPWTDIYALGATIYRAITGIAPPDALDRSHMDELKKPSELGIAISDYFERALMKALAIKAEDRFQNIDEFKAALTSHIRTGEIPRDNSHNTANNVKFSQMDIEEWQKACSINTKEAYTNYIGSVLPVKNYISEAQNRIKSLEDQVSKRNIINLIKESKNKRLITVCSCIASLLIILLISNAVLMNRYNVKSGHYYNGWRYYAGNNHIYRVKDSGLLQYFFSREKLCYADTRNYVMEVHDGWIYYKDVSNGNLYKANEFGFEQTKVCEDTIDSYEIKDGWIYYINSGNENRLYKIKIDGSNRKKINDEKTNRFYLNGDEISYSTDSGEIKMNCNSTSLNGSNNYKVFKIGDWSYYAISSDSEKGIYKENIVGVANTKEKLYKGENSLYLVGVAGEWIFFIEYDINSKSVLYRIKTDGTSKQKLFEGDIIDSISIKNGKILWISAKFNSDDIFSEVQQIYVSNLDGSNRISINAKDYLMIDLIAVIGDYLYYQEVLKDATDKISISRIKLDGTDKESLFTFKYSDEYVFISSGLKARIAAGEDIKAVLWGSPTAISDGFIYFINEEDNQLMKLDPNSGNKLKIIDNVKRFNIAGDIICYSSNSSDKEGFFRIGLDGTNEKKLLDKEVNNYFDINGEWIYYLDSEDDQKLYRINVDGGKSINVH